MTDKFDIIEYLSGLTGFVFDKAVLKRIAYDRDVWCTHDYAELSEEQKDLLRADLLYTAYISPNVWASSTHSHGSFSQTIGSQTIHIEDREKLYNAFISIYKKYDDAKLYEIEDDGSLQWL
jgi:hypothetical protein